MFCVRRPKLGMSGKGRVGNRTQNASAGYTIPVLWDERKINRINGVAPGGYFLRAGVTLNLAELK